jgi:phosphoribosylglycinamide formyltransferase-1
VKRIAFLLSGAGSTLRNLLEEIEAGRVPGEVVAVVADREAAGLEHARARGIPAEVVPAARVFEVLAPHRPDLVVLGGYLSILSIPPGWRGRVVNVHPSLLPAHGGRGMYGERVHRAVLAAGDRVSGCTVHLVDDVVDGGDVLGRAEVPVLPGDTPATLAHRVQAAERELYPRVIARLLLRDE